LLCWLTHVPEIAASLAAHTLSRVLIGVVSSARLQRSTARARKPLRSSTTSSRSVSPCSCWLCLLPLLITLVCFPMQDAQYYQWPTSVQELLQPGSVSLCLVRSQQRFTRVVLVLIGCLVRGFVCGLDSFIRFPSFHAQVQTASH
jgi:hypothetical protein